MMIELLSLLKNLLIFNKEKTLIFLSGKSLMSVMNIRHGLKFKQKRWTKTTFLVMMILSKIAKLFPVKPPQTCRISKKVLALLLNQQVEHNII